MFCLTCVNVHTFCFSYSNLILLVWPSVSGSCQGLPHLPLQPETARRCADRDRPFDECRRHGVLSKAHRREQLDYTPEEEAAIENLREDKSIVVLRADKGNAAVLLDRADYDEKALQLLNTDTYMILPKDPIAKIQASLNKMLSTIFDRYPASRGLYFGLICRNGSAPAFSGLLKVQKPDVPLRPIVDFTTSPLRALSNHLHRLLLPLTGKTDTYVRNSGHFIELTSGLELRDDESLVSFDVVSLFTTVAVPLAVSVTRAALSSDTRLSERTCLEVDEICHLLEFCLTSTYFSFAGRFYRQTSGTAMGAAVSVTVANLAMEAIERKALDTFSPGPVCFLRYVDDCFCVVKTSEIDRLHTHLNSIEPVIQFTIEHESDGCFPFLDVCAVRKSGRLDFHVYRKSIHTGRYLDFSSSHPRTHKSSVASALVRRAIVVCTSEETLRKEIETIKQDLRKNGYPARFVKSILKKLRRTSSTQDAAPPPPTRVCVPYIKGTSEVLARVLRPYGIAVSHKPVSTIGGLLPLPKDRPLRERAQGLVYKIPCGDCPASYVGEAKNFPERLRHHRYDIAKKNVEGSVLGEHVKKTNHLSTLTTAPSSERRETGGGAFCWSRGIFNAHVAT
uniref:Putative tick transposon n=1 Tax=Ixodes ricinus TaxID=34613 RepID=A0A147BN03_IXORI